MSSSADTLLSARLQEAVGRLYGPLADARSAADIRPARTDFGDFQSSLPLRLAKIVKQPAQAVANELAAAVALDDVCESVTAAGQGFLNFKIRGDWLCKRVDDIGSDPRVAVGRVDNPKHAIIDYSSPNVAKQMHVGHLRSTVIGDSLARVLSFLGHHVTRQNHLGDWGTQFGMLIQYLDEIEPRPAAGSIGALDGLYKAARRRFDEEEAFAIRARKRVVALQQHEPNTVAAWRGLVQLSLQSFTETYSRLGTDLDLSDLAPESQYNNELLPLVALLEASGMATESGGALCVFPDGFSGRDGTPLPVIVRKADGGFGYAATDLAAVRYRVNRLGADWLVYVVDVRQTLHFEQIFAVARAAGWLPPGVRTDHVAFGTVLGPDGKPFKTRSGETVTLESLLDAAEEKASALIRERGSKLEGPRLTRAIRDIGVGAIKYADLSNDLRRDYVFDVDRMVAMDGDTGPYIQYAHARLSSVLAKAGRQSTWRASRLDTPAEHHLAVLLDQFEQIVSQVAERLEPHRLCTYLFTVATAVSSFYEQCPILTAPEDVKQSRLALCEAARRTLALGLHLLGMASPEEM
jgi:arginyl-tRNA synthetase